MSDEETTPVSDPRPQVPAEAPTETASGAPVMLLVIIGGLFAALILFGVLVRQVFLLDRDGKSVPV